MMVRRVITLKTWLPVLILLGLLTTPVFGQDLEPRFFSQVPTGMNFAALSAMHLEGGIVFDQATTIEDATGDIWGLGAGYVRTLGVLGASSKLQLAVPVMSGDWKGTYQGAPASRSSSGLADPSVEWSVNFIGAPAMKMKDMRGFQQKWVVGASLKATIPLGQYDPEKLLNLGANRWGLRTRLGASRKWERFTFEAMGSIWFFTKNDDFFGGNTLEQDPLYSLQFNGIYEFPSRIWLGLGAGFSRGGQGSTNDVSSDSYNKNTRWAAILSYPIAKKHSVKVLYISQVSTRVGSDFDQFTLGWSMRWGGEN
jgi:hypothetical protein